MPYFRDLLSESEIDAVVAQVKQFSTAFNGASPQGIVVPPRPATTAASVERGRALYIAQDCVGCHGADGRKGGFLVDSSTNHPTPIRDLSAPWTFRGGSDPNQIWLRLTTGVGNSMPSYAHGLTPGQRWDLVSYVQSLARVAPSAQQCVRRDWSVLTNKNESWNRQRASYGESNHQIDSFLNRGDQHNQRAQDQD